MKILVQYLSGCPNVEALLHDIRAVLPTSSGCSLESQMIETMEDAQRLDFRGSPTILVDGVDHFEDGNAEVGLSCRLYVTSHGVRGRPSREQLQRIMQR